MINSTRPAHYKALILLLIICCYTIGNAAEIKLEADEAFNQMYTSAEVLAHLSTECAIAIKVNIQTSHQKCNTWLKYLKGREGQRFGKLLGNETMRDYIKNIISKNDPVRLMTFTSNLETSNDNQRFIESYISAYTAE